MRRTIAVAAAALTLAAPAAAGGDGAEMIRQLLRMIDGETMQIDAVVEEVLVNAGKPDPAY